MKRPERELLGQERRRIRGVKSPGKRNRIGAFGLWGRILTVVAPVSLTAVVLASFFTPMLAVEKIAFVGNERIAAADLESALSGLYDRPMTTISDEEIAELLSGFSLIETFTSQAEPPHTLRVSIRERQPILILVRSGKNYLYDAAGVQIAATEEISKYPFLVFDGNPIESPRFSTAVKLLFSLPLETYSQVFSVEVSESLTSKLVLRKGNLTVFWGSTDEGLLKSKVLDSLLATGVRDALTIDVSSPNSPVVQYPN
ncbi:MAG: FtsQ-type POTRA domain-containing protein [Actinomycetales bacterium]